MAVDDVLAAIRDAITPLVNTVSGCGIGVDVGWPEPEEVKKIIDAQNALVTVYAVPRTTRNTSAYRPQTVYGTAPAATIFAMIANGVVTLSGASTLAGQIIGVAIPQAAAATYVCTGSESLATIAASLATSLTTAGVATSSAGATFTPSTTAAMLVTVGNPSAALSEVGRRSTRILVAIWVPTPALRTAIADAITSFLGTTDFPYITVGGINEGLVYATEGDSDANSSDGSGFYRRIYFDADYGVYRALTLTPIVVVGAQIAQSPSGATVISYD